MAARRPATSRRTSPRRRQSTCWPSRPCMCPPDRMPRCTLREGRMMLAPATMDTHRRTMSRRKKPQRDAGSHSQPAPQPASARARDQPTHQAWAPPSPVPPTFSSRGEGVGTPAPQRTGMPRHKSKRARTWVAEPHKDVPTTAAEPHTTAYPRRRGWWSSCTRRTRRSPRRTPRCRLHSANDSRRNMVTHTRGELHAAAKRGAMHMGLQK